MVPGFMPEVLIAEDSQPDLDFVECASVALGAMAQEVRSGGAMSRVIEFAIAVSMSLTVACAGHRIGGELAAPRAPVPHDVASDALRVGAAEADITPIPGYPMGGHGPAGTIGRGVWTRLKARATYVEDASGGAVAFVACDLWAVPAGLTDAVVEKVQRDPAGRALSRNRIVLAATHTHQSPGNYSSSDAYNLFASRIPGFDPELFDFLAVRIASAIVAAAREAVPAQAFFGESTATNLARNRSLGPYRLDPEAANASLDPERAAREAVDPRVRVFAFRAVQAPRDWIAVQVFVAVHNTAMDHGTQVYQGDLFGASARLLAWRLAADAARDHASRRPVVSIFNGAEGDVRPDTGARDRLETLRLASSLTAAAQRALDTSAAVDGRWRQAMRRLDLPNQCSEDADANALCPAATAAMGMATPGGASDGPTLFRELIWVDGVHGALRRSRQGPKQPAIDIGDALALSSTPVDHFWNLDLTSLIARKVAAPPTVMPLGFFRFGPLGFVTLPVEATTTMGRRIETAVAERLEPQGPVIVIGLANEYLSYVATPEEYEAQHYEGASTLYGPASGPLMQKTLVALATQEIAGDPEAGRYAYDVGNVRRFGAEGVGEPPFVVDDGLSDLLEDAAGRPDRHAPRFCWSAPRPEWPPRGPAALAETPIPAVAIETRSGHADWTTAILDGRPQTDEGVDVVTVLERVAPDTLSWCAFWALGSSTATPEQEFRFRVSAPGGRPCVSEPLPKAEARRPATHFANCGALEPM